MGRPTRENRKGCLCLRRLAAGKTTLDLISQFRWQGRQEGIELTAQLRDALDDLVW